MTKNKTTKLPEKFRHLMWSYRFSEVDANKHRERIIVNTVNYGEWWHWKWIANYYGKQKLKKTIQEIPESEFRNERALSVISLILGIKKMRYENRSDKIRSKRAFARA